MQRETHSGRERDPPIPVGASSTREGGRSLTAMQSSIYCTCLPGRKDFMEPFYRYPFAVVKYNSIHASLLNYCRKCRLSNAS